MISRGHRVDSTQCFCNVWFRSDTYRHSAAAAAAAAAVFLSFFCSRYTGSDSMGTDYLLLVWV